MTFSVSRQLGLVLLVATAVVSAGCAVPQSQDVAGKTGQIVEPVTNRAYYLYLPKDYDPAKRYPLIVSVHGMKPFDNAFPQLMTWRKICDDNGWVAIAPQLRSPDLLNQFPFRKIDSALLEDESLIVAAIHDVSRRCSIDASRVMLTGWSSGGYLIHYIGARHPELFCLIAPQGSNFHESIMPGYVNDAARRLPVYIYHGASDLAVIIRDSNAAVQWYVRNGYSNVKMDEAPGGHERHPQLAARYFQDLILGGAPVATAGHDAGQWLGKPAAPSGPVPPAGPTVAVGPTAAAPRTDPLVFTPPATTRQPAGPQVPPPDRAEPPAAQIEQRYGVRLPPAPPGRVDTKPNPSNIVAPPDRSPPSGPAPDGQVIAVTLPGSAGEPSAAPRVISAGPSVDRPAEAVAPASRHPQTVHDSVARSEPTAAGAVAVPLGPAVATLQKVDPADGPGSGRVFGDPPRLPSTAVAAAPVAPALAVAAPTPPGPGSIQPINEPLTPTGPDDPPVGRVIPTSPTPQTVFSPLSRPQAVPHTPAHPAVRILPSADEGPAPLTVEFRCELRGIDSPIVRYRWRTGQALFSTTHFAMLTFQQPGDWQVELSVTDAAGNTYRGSTTVRVAK